MAHDLERAGCSDDIRDMKKNFLSPSLSYSGYYQPLDAVEEEQRKDEFFAPFNPHMQQRGQLQLEEEARGHGVGRSEQHTAKETDGAEDYEEDAAADEDDPDDEEDDHATHKQASSGDRCRKRRPSPSAEERSQKRQPWRPPAPDAVWDGSRRTADAMADLYGEGLHPMWNAGFNTFTHEQKKQMR